MKNWMKRFDLFMKLGDSNNLLILVYMYNKPCTYTGILGSYHFASKIIEKILHNFEHCISECYQLWNILMITSKKYLYLHLSFLKYKNKVAFFFTKSSISKFENLNTLFQNDSEIVLGVHFTVLKTLSILRKKIVQFLH